MSYKHICHDGDSRNDTLPHAIPTISIEIVDAPTKVVLVKVWWIIVWCYEGNYEIFWLCMQWHKIYPDVCPSLPIFCMLETSTHHMLWWWFALNIIHIICKGDWRVRNFYLNNLLFCINWARISLNPTMHSDELLWMWMGRQSFDLWDACTIQTNITNHYITTALQCCQSKSAKKSWTHFIVSKWLSDFINLFIEMTIILNEWMSQLVYYWQSITNSEYLVSLNQSKCHKTKLNFNENSVLQEYWVYCIMWKTLPIFLLNKN